MPGVRPNSNQNANQFNNFGGGGSDVGVNPNATKANNAFVHEQNETLKNQTQNLKAQGAFTRDSQNAQTQSAMASVATENSKTAQNSQINAAKGVQY
jgi:hypothetical protein